MAQPSRSTFHALLTGAMPAVRRYALALTRDPARADDLLQAVMLRALEKRHRFEAGTSIKAWLHTICFNLFVNDLRGSGRTVAADPVVLADLLTANPAAPDRIELRETLATLGRLPSQMREAILLRADGLSYEEIAEATGVIIGSVKSRLCRGRAELAQRCGRC